MIEWEVFNEEMNEIDNILDYSKKVEETVFHNLKNIFKYAIISKETRDMAKIIYDYVVETTRMKLFCDIKFEKISLQRFWKNQVSIISNQLKKLNKTQKKRLKYLLILIESEDSIAKMNLSPIYPHILVINLKMLFEIRNFLVYQNQDYLNLFENIIRESSGVLYDNFIRNLVELLGYIELSNIEKKIERLQIDNSLLKLNKRNLINYYKRKISSEKRKKEIEDTKIVEKILKLEYEKQGEISRNEIAEHLDINMKDAEYYYNLITSPKHYSQFEKTKLELEGKRVLQKIKQPTLFDLIHDFGYRLTLAKKIGQYLIDNGMIYKFSNIPEKKYKCQITLLSFDEKLTKTYENFLINLLEENEFKVEIINYFYNIDDILERIKVANIIIADLTNNNPNIIYLVGRTHRMKDFNTVIQICQINQEIPQLLEKYKTFFYMKPIEADNKFQYELLNYIENICGRY